MVQNLLKISWGTTCHALVCIAPAQTRLTARMEAVHKVRRMCECHVNFPSDLVHQYQKVPKRVSALQLNQNVTFFSVRLDLGTIWPDSPKVIRNTMRDRLQAHLSTMEADGSPVKVINAIMCLSGLIRRTAK